LSSALTDQLEAAVLALAGHGVLKDRLSAAFSDHLDGIDEHELPEEVQGDFSELTRAMHAARVLPGDSVVRASVRKFSSEETQRFAALIVRLYSAQLQSEPAAQKIPLRVAGAAHNVTPLAALLALEGGGGSAPPRHATGP
jgi:hypothetical protein